MSEPTRPAGADAQQASFQIEKIYVKDLSLEVPNAPQIFPEAQEPQLEVQVRNQGGQFADNLYEVVVSVTVTTTATSNSPSANCAASLRTWISSCGASACMKTCGAFGTSSDMSLT